MITIAIEEKSIDLARAIERAKCNTSATQRIDTLLNVSILQSQLQYLYAIQLASNNVK